MKMTGDAKSLPTRRMILNLLKTAPARTVAEMAQQLELTEMAIRRHLNVMEKEGIVKYTLVRQAIGRPLKMYSLTPKAEEYFPKNYKNLALELLDELGQSQPELVRELFEKRMERMLNQYKPRMTKKRLSERVVELAKIQNASGYMAEWEQLGDGTYALKEFNCPISQIANVYHEACDCELKLFETLLDAGVERTECLAMSGSKCTYIIRPDSERS